MAVWEVKEEAEGREDKFDVLYFSFLVRSPASSVSGCFQNVNVVCLRIDFSACQICSRELNVTDF